MEAEREIILLKARVSAELRQVAAGSATQGLWLVNKKKTSGKKRLEELGKEEEEPATE